MRLIINFSKLTSRMISLLFLVKKSLKLGKSLKIFLFFSMVKKLLIIELNSIILPLTEVRIIPQSILLKIKL